MKITTTMVEDEVYEAITDQGKKVRIDMRPVEVRSDQSPVELLLSAVAACGAVDIVLMLKKRRKTINSFTIESEGIRREHSPRSFTNIHCKYIVTSSDVTEDELLKAAKLSIEKYCSVADSLKAEITISAHVKRPSS
jgi:putative redox protein